MGRVDLLDGVLVLADEVELPVGLLILRPRKSLLWKSKHMGFNEKDENKEGQTLDVFRAQITIVTSFEVSNLRTKNTFITAVYDGYYKLKTTRTP